MIIIIIIMLISSMLFFPQAADGRSGLVAVDQNK